MHSDSESSFARYSVPAIKGRSKVPGLHRYRKTTSSSSAPPFDFFKIVSIVRNANAGSLHRESSRRDVRFGYASLSILEFKMQGKVQERILEAKVQPYLGKIWGFNNSLKCVHAMTFGEGLDLAKCLNVAEDRPTPSLAIVPFPNSSSRQRDLERQSFLQEDLYFSKPIRRSRLSANLLVESRSILLICVRSKAKVDCGMALDSWLPMRVKILSVNPTTAESAGTNDPICAINTISPTCFE
jgi:hypothetical protein